MRKNLMPQARNIDGVDEMQWHLSAGAMEKWDSSIYAAEDEASISMFDPIGADYVDGVTAKRVASVLRALGGKDVTVNINSPGGNMFEGVTIYNLLRDYKGHVTVRVMGIAASAASLIAMAGDDIQIARAGFLMIHNCHVLAIGNRNAMRGIADKLENFDRMMAEIYATRTETDAKKIGKLMDEETYIGGTDAVSGGFADELLPADAKTTARAEAKEFTSMRTVDLALAMQGMPRAKRREVLADLTGKPSAAEEEKGRTPRAPDDTLRAVVAVDVVLDVIRSVPLPA